MLPLWAWLAGGGVVAWWLFGSSSSSSGSGGNAASGNPSTMAFPTGTQSTAPAASVTPPSSQGVYPPGVSPVFNPAGPAGVPGAVNPPGVSPVFDPAGPAGQTSAQTSAQTSGGPLPVTYYPSALRLWRF
jgi:hypothetical protein